MKRFKFNYLLIGIVTLLLAVALWPSVPWFDKAENRIAAIQARGVLRVSTIASPLTYSVFNGKASGLDYELAQQFADYLGVKLEITVRPTIDALFDDLDNNAADLLAAGLVYNNDRSQHYQAGPTYYSVSQQMVYRVGSPRPKTLGGVKANQLVLSPGLAVLTDLQALKESKYHDLSWRIDDKHTSTELLQQVVKGNIAFTISDSIAISIFQRVHPRLAVALDVTDEQPVTWFSHRDNDDSLSAALLDFYNRLSGDGTLARLEEKYLGHVGDFDYVDTRTFLKAVDTVLPELQPLFEKYATDIDWRLLAAISYQESHWDSQATSPTGVRGLMMLTKNTAQSLGLTDRLDPEQSIGGGSRYLKDMMGKVPETVPEDERIWFALAAYNMGYAHMLDARQLTAKLKGNPDSWADVKMRLPLLSQKQYYSRTTYGYARGHEAYAYVENIRKYQLSLEGYLLEKEKQAAQEEKFAEAYPAVAPVELAIPRYGPIPLGPFSPADARERNHSALPNTGLPLSPR
ncbi:membrane-bound lytic murein transglycosylase MltF [Enterobacteriaceae bacterium H11S18]|uniref:membrane-bound lytic murein transglycosylase MltF n=1 Tax=Dryocola clanedunensis TaxID=2925396 RepID=UPI0022F0DF3D|nr:membrane-bound lytic murein transglycosylase MltF [Dryocola clanedunensis]MCT4707213.1 membrane-bound lytic murein transglycosylase MltF [Dryocola clanedunensis]MCT4712724.1 membrane-bound lytic murein transglycosylase MltF [Dryocola clanedunensis]